jgi:UDP-glucose 4-epimerase
VVSDISAVKAHPVIVTGACGFMGFYLVRQLQEAGYSVLAVDKRMTEEAEFLIKSGVSFTAVDISREEEFGALPKDGAFAFINLACVQPANMPTDDSDPAKYIGVNTLGVANILKYCRANNITKMLHTISHRNVQGLWERGERITEESPRAIKFTGKFSLFSISESAAADIIEYYNQQHGMNCVIFRLPSVYGFGHHVSFLANGKSMQTGFGAFIENAANARPIEVWGNREVGRDVIYVKDVVSAILLAIKEENAGVSGIFNIASGKVLSLQAQVDSIIKVFAPKDRAPQIVYRPEKPNSVEACLYDISKAKRVLGWQPQYSFEDMLVDYKLEMERGKLNFLLTRKIRMIAEESPETAAR